MNRNYAVQRMDFERVSATGALDLVWNVFQEFEAPEYADRGIREFRDFIAPQAVEARMHSDELLVWGGFADDRVVGVIAMRPPCHISLLFVEKAYHRQGIAKALLETVLEHYRAAGHTEMTVHASPYAHEAYRRLGFKDTGAEQTVNGLRFIPMKQSLT